MAISRSVRLDRKAVDHMLHSRTGEVGRVMAGFAGLATQEIRQVASERVQTRTGRYKAGIHSRLLDGNRLVVEADAPYSVILERGSRPHLIVPRRQGGFLRFTIGNRVIYAKQVHHPGTKPYRIMETGIRRAAGRLNRLARS